MPQLSKILIANRGEIALRVMRTAKSMGLDTVAVYSDADRAAPHVRAADEAIHIGSSAVGESYLRIDRIIDAARVSGADAVHPGYGFLSENAAFATACAEAGLTFIGPPAPAIDVMGDKARAKRAMVEAGVPCVPGYQGEDQSDATLIAAAREIGFAVMVKAAAGGGGRGMRLVHDAEALPRAIELARSEAQNAFGSGDLIIEKAISHPRHVEIQVFADAHGNVIHLGERDCSVQRRHQKVVEEAPCPVMTQELRAAMGAAAVNAARAVDYRGAGTVEFLLDADGRFYFLEMNTRLQVEHPVTEMVTGLDLVALQIKVAQGEPLGVSQEDVSLNGHAIEVRLYAEDPTADFLPSTGPVDLWQPPAGTGIRVDAGIETAGEVSPFYDPMVAKIMAHGRTRDEARRRLKAALGQTALFGPATNRDFLIDVLSQPTFVQGRATTAFIGETYGPDGYRARAPSLASMAPAMAIQFALGRNHAQAQALGIPDELVGWSSTHDLESSAMFQAGEETKAVLIRPHADGEVSVTSGEESVALSVEVMLPHQARVVTQGRREDIIFHRPSPDRIRIATSDEILELTEQSQRLADAQGEGGGGRVVAPMHGRLLELAVAEGQAVKKGDKLAVLEAMKMQHEIVAEVDGVVSTVLLQADQQIAADDLILEITPSES